MVRNSLLKAITLTVFITIGVSYADAKVMIIGKGDKLNFSSSSIPQDLSGAFNVLQTKCTQCHTMERIVIAIQTGIAPVSGQPFDKFATKAYGIQMLRKPKSNMTRDEVKAAVNLMNYLLAEGANGAIETSVATNIEQSQHQGTTPNNSNTSIKKVADKQVQEKLDIKVPIITISSPEIYRGVKLTAREASIMVTGIAIDDIGVATVTVNGQTAALDANGNFSAEVFLKIGENQIVISSMNVNKNTAIERFTISRETGNPTKATATAKHSPSGAYHALIIGNNNYRYLDRLKTAEHDAQEIDRVLRENFGFQTKVLFNATRSEIKTALNDLGRKVKSHDNVLIYYAGHGEYLSEKAYWLPVDAQRDNDIEWIIADDITTSIKRLPSKHVLIVSDSCYSGTLTRSSQTNLLQPSEREEFLKKMADRPSRTLMASGGNEPVADGGGSGHSIFAESFIKALREMNRAVFAADELFYQHVKSRVAGKSDQVPQYSEIRNSGHEGGDFLFIRK